MGLRNPFRFSFDRATGDLLIGDVGGGAREEIDWIASPASSRGAELRLAVQRGEGRPGRLRARPATSRARRPRRRTSSRCSTTRPPRRRRDLRRLCRARQLAHGPGRAGAVRGLLRRRHPLHRQLTPAAPEDASSSAGRTPTLDILRRGRRGADVYLRTLARQRGPAPDSRTGSGDVVVHSASRAMGPADRDCHASPGDRRSDCSWAERGRDVRAGGEQATRRASALPRSPRRPVGERGLPVVGRHPIFACYRAALRLLHGPGRGLTGRRVHDGRVRPRRFSRSSTQVPATTTAGSSSSAPTATSGSRRETAAGRPTTFMKRRTPAPSSARSSEIDPDLSRLALRRSAPAAPQPFQAT